jgi:hypothetical protein
MRQLSRHGGGAMIERAFTGFVALPRPKSCWEILGVLQALVGTTLIAHTDRGPPDFGGSNRAMAELNKARDEALGIS